MGASIGDPHNSKIRTTAPLHDSKAAASKEHQHGGEKGGGKVHTAARRAPAESTTAVKIME